MIRVAVDVYGTIQGVGFRPFVYRAAVARGLAGWVKNNTEGVRIEVQGPTDVVRDFVGALAHEPPAPGRVERLVVAQIAPSRDTGFVILDSHSDAAVHPAIPADQAICAECLAEIESPQTRRYRYPFTNCTRCGPRYTIIERLPYDRPRTTMRGFALCAACAAEYADASDRRFHAQPIACPDCGPRIRLVSAAGDELARGDAALRRAVADVLAGRILALKGLGGFQLLVDATSAAAVTRLRQRKGREEKPFAVMFPSLAAVRSACAPTPAEESLLASPEAPIVLVRRRPGAAQVVDQVAPRNPYLGVLLPYTPLHHLALSAARRPLVCTSGNRSDEPMCIDDEEARLRLGDVADVFLLHDRAIVRPLDDSIARVGPTGVQVLRRARGFAPLPLRFVDDAPCILALGGQLKSTVALARDGQVVVSQHLGDLFTLDGTLLLERVVADLVGFFAARPAVIACDLHPDYASTRLAERLAGEWAVPVEPVQHHHAHVAACMAEHGLGGPLLGLAWDGAGLGSDGTLWGGEALVVDGPTFRRAAHLRPFALPGGEQAIREPRRAALGLLHEVLGAAAIDAAGTLFSGREVAVLLGMLERRVQAPRTTSIGRLFDAVAALLGIRERCRFEGQAAMELEFAAEGSEDRSAYPFTLGGGDPAVADWEPLLRALLLDRARGLPAGIIATRFHNALARLAEDIAMRVGLARVVLSGGCFQNLRLLRTVRERLVGQGFEVFLPERYPPHDGGLALGQAYVVALRRKEPTDVSRHSR